MEFWFFVAFLILISMAIIAFAILRRVTSHDDAHRQRIIRNVKLYQQRLASLEDELTQDFISQENFDSLTNELSRQLLNDVGQLEQAPVESHGRQKWLYLLLPVPLFALVIYTAIGGYSDWLITQQLIDLSNSETIEEYEKHSAGLHVQLIKRVEQKPDHIDYRNLLARFSMGKKDYEQAALHYGILSELLPEDADTLALYVQAEYLRNGRKLTAEIASAMDQALRLDPHQTTVLGIQGIHALEAGDLQGAIDAWEQLLQALPPGSEQAQLISQGIKKAKQELGQPIDDPEVAEVNDGITVSVTVAEELASIDGNIPVFIFATASSGPPMPLAVQKIRLKDLPAEIRLDDSMAMMPEMQLSKFDKINIVARIALSGEAIAKPGDWQGEISGILWKDVEKAEIQISTLVK